jgi:hypothetical protein
MVVILGVKNMFNIIKSIKSIKSIVCKEVWTKEEISELTCKYVQGWEEARGYKPTWEEVESFIKVRTTLPKNDKSFKKDLLFKWDVLEVYNLYRHLKHFQYIKSYEEFTSYKDSCEALPTPLREEMMGFYTIISRVYGVGAQCN